MVQIHTEKNQKEIKRHGNYEFPVNISPESIQSYEQGYFLLSLIHISKKPETSSLPL